MSGSELVIVGAGVIGCAIARELARQGARPLLLERGQPVLEASWAAAGMLSPLAEASGPGAFLSLARQSLLLYPQLSDELRAETGIDIGYRDEGTLAVALDHADLQLLDARHAWQVDAGLPAERISPEKLLELEPLVASSASGAYWLPEDHQVDSRKLSAALLESARATGARLRTGCEVASISIEGGRARGVELVDGERIGADAVIIAAGSWSGTIRGLPRTVPTHPVHGQLLAVQLGPSDLTRVIHTPRVYVVPRRDGRMILGATTESIGFRKSVSPEGTKAILEAASQAVPALAEAGIVESWSGLRPGTPDELPILGPDPEVAGLHYATGHYRNGILLAPITGQLIAESILHAPAAALEPFSIVRFN